VKTAFSLGMLRCICSSERAVSHALRFRFLYEKRRYLEVNQLLNHVFVPEEPIIDLAQNLNKKREGQPKHNFVI
jgi:hypothetical protein